MYMKIYFSSNHDHSGQMFEDFFRMALSRPCSTVKACYKGAGPNLIKKCWLWHHIKITTWKIRKRKELAIPSRIKVFNSIQNDMYRPWSALLHLKNVPFSKRFVPLPKRFVSFSKRFIPSPKRSVSFSKRFVPYKAFKSFRSKRSVQSVRKSSGVFIVIIKMAIWEWRRIESSLLYFEIKF